MTVFILDCLSICNSSFGSVYLVKRSNVVFYYYNNKLNWKIIAVEIIGSFFREVKDSIFILIKYHTFKIIPLSNMQPHTMYTFLHINILIHIYISLQNRSFSMFYRGKMFHWDLHLTFPNLFFRNKLTHNFNKPLKFCSLAI